MQSFGLLSDDTLVAEAPEVINDSLKSIASDFAGPAFPTTNLFAFMTCFRTDEQKLYRLQGDLTTWLPEIPDSVAHATNADHATTADSATNATNADHATTADSATNATNADHATTADSATNATNAATAAGLTDAVISALMLKMYPVGSIYASTASTNPGTLFGGTWEALPAGRVLLAQGTSTWGTTYAAGSTGGEATHTLTIGELPSHNHWVTPNVLMWAAASQRNEANQSLAPQVALGSGGATSGTDGPYFIDRLISSVRYVQDNGSSEAHNIMQPFISVYMFKRTA